MAKFIHMAKITLIIFNVRLEVDINVLVWNVDFLANQVNFQKQHL